MLRSENKNSFDDQYGKQFKQIPHPIIQSNLSFGSFHNLQHNLVGYIFFFKSLDNCGRKTVEP